MGSKGHRKNHEIASRPQREPPRAAEERGERAGDEAPAGPGALCGDDRHRPGATGRGAETSIDHEDELDTVVLGSAGPHGRSMYGDVRMQTKLHGGDRRDDADLAPGVAIGPYDICETLGRGGCSTVYVAEHRGRGERVAIKVLSPGLAMSQRQVRRFVQEAQAVQKIRHAGIVDIHESGYLDDGRPYLVMELIEGRSLAEAIGEQGRFAPQRAADILEPVCEALHHAHAAGIVHRDIKASNIMLAGGPDAPVVKLVDFGIAKLMTGGQESSLKTTIGHVLGTPYSMAPEQILGRPVDSRTDTYALGALLFRMLTGRHPFHCRDPQTVVHMQLKAPPPKPSTFAPVPVAVDEVVQRAMAKDPEHRFSDPRRFVAALRRALQPRRASEASVPALAIYVHGLASERDVDDALLVDLMNALDVAEAFLREEGFQIALQTSEAVLGVMPQAGGNERRRVLEAARRLHQALAQRPDADARLHLNVCVHWDRARVHVGVEGGPVHIAGGAIIDVGGWAPQTQLAGVHATGAVMGAPDVGYMPVDAGTAGQG